MKIVSAAIAMLSKKDLISNVVEGIDGSEYFFLFAGKHKWSITKSANQHSLFFYSTRLSVDELSNYREEEWENFKGMIRYSSKEIGGEAVKVFDELYEYLSNRAVGIEEALDEIIELGDIPS